MYHRKNLIGLLVYTLLLIQYLIVLNEYDVIYIQNKRRLTSEVFKITQQFHEFYFTFWNFTCQIIFVVLAITAELFELIRVPRLICDIVNGLRGDILNSIVFPSTLFVASCFWILYIIDTNLVIPAEMKEFYPNWINYTVHGAILIPIFMEYFYLPKRFPTISLPAAAKIFTFFFFIYETLLFGVFGVFRIWIYPVFMFLSWRERGLFVFLTYLYTLSLLTVGVYVQNRKPIVTREYYTDPQRNPSNTKLNNSPSVHFKTEPLNPPSTILNTDRTEPNTDDTIEGTTTTELNSEPISVPSSEF